MCVDFCSLNHQTRLDMFPIPRIHDLLDKLRKARVFSAVDLQSAYHQVCIKEGHEHCTDFLTPMGLYEYVVMRLGLTNAPARCQGIMNQKFRICCTSVLQCTWMTSWCFLTPSSSTWLTSRKCLNGSAHCSLKQSIKNANSANVVQNTWGMLWKTALCTLTLIKYQLYALGQNPPM